MSQENVRVVRLGYEPMNAAFPGGDHVVATVEGRGYGRHSG
jgi:hypothetical protein